MDKDLGFLRLTKKFLHLPQYYAQKSVAKIVEFRGHFMVIQKCMPLQHVIGTVPLILQHIFKPIYLSAILYK